MPETMHRNNGDPRKSIENILRIAKFHKSRPNLISRNFELKINFVTIPFLYRQYKQFRACSEKQIFLFKKICIDEKSQFFHNVHFGKSKSSFRVWNLSRLEYFASGIFRVLKLWLGRPIPWTLPCTVRKVLRM